MSEKLLIQHARNGVKKKFIIIKLMDGENKQKQFMNLMVDFFTGVLSVINPKRLM